MKLIVIGFGQAGGKAVDKSVEYDRERNAGIICATVAVNSARVDLLGLKNIPKDQRVLIGQSRVEGHGVSADNELDAEIAEEDIDEIQGAIDSIPVHEVGTFLVVSGFGGDTSSDGAPVLAKRPKHICTKSVYGLGILPESDEGGICTLNVACSLRTFIREVDNLLMFDNDTWRKTGESVWGGYGEVNEEIINRFDVFFGADEVQGGQEVVESVIDSSEIISTLAGDDVSTIGYVPEEVGPWKDNGGGLLSRLTGGDRPGDNLDTTHTTSRTMSLVREAALGRLMLPCEIEDAECTLLVLAGSPEHLSQKDIGCGRKWIEEQTGSMEARGGDYPTPGVEKTVGVVLLSGVMNVPRIKELQQVIIEIQDNIEETRQKSDSNLEILISDDEDELGSFF